MPGYKLAIIIPVFNQWSLTKKCLLSLQEHTDLTGVQVIVVDNASSDATPQACPSLGSELFGTHFTYLGLQSNINFGPGCNAGAQKADALFLLFLNNDIVLTPHWLPPLFAAMDSVPNLGAVGPILLYPQTQRIQHLGVAFTPANRVVHLYHNFPSTHPVVQRTRDLQAITGAALMLPSTIFNQCGGFWPEYRNGYEDLDLCAQIRRQGKVLQCVPQSQVFHWTSQSTGRFDHESENARILSARCQYLFSPDEHLFAHEDGYVLRLEKDLRASLVLVRNLKATKTWDLDTIHRAVLDEPLWEHGYDLLLQELFQRQLWPEALDILLLQQNFFKSETIITNLAKVATKMGNEELMHECRLNLQQIREVQKSRDLKHKWSLLHQWAQTKNDQILLVACQQWQEQYWSQL